MVHEGSEKEMQKMRSELENLKAQK